MRVQQRIDGRWVDMVEADPGRWVVQCGYRWHRRADHDGDHWAQCQLPEGHTEPHRDGTAWVTVGSETTTTDEAITKEKNR